MRDYMPKRGKLGHDMMFRSCTIQVRGRRICFNHRQAWVTQEGAWLSICYDYEVLCHRAPHSLLTLLTACSLMHV